MKIPKASNFHGNLFPLAYTLNKLQQFVGETLNESNALKHDYES